MKAYQLLSNGKLNFQSRDLQKIKARAWDESNRHPQFKYQIVEVEEQ